MTADPPPHGAHLAADESPIAAEMGTLVSETGSTLATVCLTDRRILVAAVDGGFVDVPRDAVRSIRSTATTSRSDRELLALGLAVGGVGLAAIAGGALLVEAGPAALAAALVAAIGAVAAGVAWRLDVALDGDHVGAAVDRLDGAIRAVDGLGDVSAHRRYEDRAAAAVADNPVVLGAAGLLVLAGVVALVALGAWTALAATAGGLAGIAAAERGVRTLRTLDRRDQRVRRERDVTLHLVDGRDVRFRIDAEATIDRELSRLTAERPVAALPAETGRSSEEASTGGRIATGEHPPDPGPAGGD